MRRNKEQLPQHIPAGETPTIRLHHMVHGDFIFAGTYAEAGVHKAYMNAYGAVSVVATNGELLGILPSEFEWVTGKPTRWGHGDARTVYIIEPYSGDWTTDSFYERKRAEAAS